MACNFSLFSTSTKYPASLNPVEAYQPTRAPSEDHLHEYLRKLLCRDPSHYNCFKNSFVNKPLGPRGRKKSRFNYLLECTFTKWQGEGNDGQEQTRLSYYKLVSVEFHMIFIRLSVYACILHWSISISLQCIFFLYIFPSLSNGDANYSVRVWTFVVGVFFSPKMLFWQFWCTVIHKVFLSNSQLSINRAHLVFSIILCLVPLKLLSLQYFTFFYQGRHETSSGANTNAKAAAWVSRQMEGGRIWES